MSGDPRNEPQRLLVVEDDTAVGPLIVHYLEHAGYDVFLAREAEAAIAAAREHEYDLVISDLVLADGDGHEIVDAIRASSRASRSSSCRATALRTALRRTTRSSRSRFRQGQIIERVERLLAA
jgi:CheY-like chemotaxis protein